jgi:alpha-ketoglutarate-dependent 2,4-dichlorophenoxyacetate dioxygenase
LGISITSLDTFGAEISGIDIGAPISRAETEAIRSAIDSHGVLVFRRPEPLTDTQQIDFTGAFGPLQHLRMLKMLGGGATRLDRSELIDVSNLDEAGEIVGAEDRRRSFHDGNRLWHTDVSFDDNRAVYSVLSARVLPPAGADTDFANMAAAYAALPADRKAELEGLEAEHSIWYSKALGGFTDVTEAEKATRPAARHPLVTANPRSGGKALYLASHASHIVGWPEDKGRALLDDLIEFATQDRFTYTHVWQPGDVVMWDNQSTMHRATEFDDLTHVRDMRRVTTLEQEMTV